MTRSHGAVKRSYVQVVGWEPCRHDCRSSRRMRFVRLRIAAVIHEKLLSGRFVLGSGTARSSRLVVAWSWSADVDALFSPEDVAAQCGLSRKAVYRAIDRGELKASRLCSRLRIRPQDVERWIAADEVAEGTGPSPMPSAGVPSTSGLRLLLRARRQ